MGLAYLRSRWHELPPSVQVSFCTALRHLLPALTESQYDALNADQKSTLWTSLSLASDTDAFLTLQILDLQGRLGDPKNAEIRRILTMLTRQDVPVSHKEIPVTARTALAELNRRAEQEHLAKRCCVLPGASAQPIRDTHLRPAAAPGKTREEELLRPAKPARRRSGKQLRCLFRMRARVYRIAFRVGTSPACCKNPSNTGRMMTIVYVRELLDRLGSDKETI